MLENSGAKIVVAYPSYQPFVKQIPDTPSSGPALSISPGQELQDTPNIQENIFPDTLLYIFRHNMVSQFPFVVIPEGISAAELSQTKPFLFKTVIMVASYHDKSGQARMAKEIFQYLSAHMIIANEKSLDLLQGLLVLTAWSVGSYLHLHRRSLNFAPPGTTSMSTWQGG